MTNDDLSAHVSALVDHEDSPRQRQQVFDRILTDDGARRAWRDYHLIGCAMRGEVERTGADLSARICARLEDEPTVLAPAGRLAGVRGRGWKSTWRSTWKSAGALALAASVALAAVITLGPSGGEEDAGGVIAGDARIVDEVGEMLAQHGEFTSSPGLNGLAGYAKLVSNELLQR